MSFRDILVHLKSHEEWSAHVDYAIGVSKSFDAHLRGLVTFSDVSVMRSLSIYGKSMVTEQMEKDAAVARVLEEKFRAGCGANGVPCSFDTAEGQASEIMPWAARLHDLTIIEQRNPAADESGFDAAEETALSAGRPVLLIPRIGRFDPNPDHILIAWNGGHQAAAAVHGALPFIRRAKRVTICSGELKLPLRATARVPDISLSGNLKLHGPEVKHEVVEVGAAHVGAHLLERANELGCGMIVMGAYGRSWFSEFVLGGATRHIFANMTVPVLTGR